MPQGRFKGVSSQERSREPHVGVSGVIEGLFGSSMELQSVSGSSVRVSGSSRGPLGRFKRSQSVPAELQRV